MRRIVILKVHFDDDTEKSDDFRHVWFHGAMRGKYPTDFYLLHSCSENEKNAL